MSDFDDSQLLDLVDIHKECYPTASASTRSQVLKQLKRKGVDINDGKNKWVIR